MNTKLLTGVFVLMFLVGIASAAVTFDPVSFSRNIDQGDTTETFTFTLNNSDATAYTSLNWEFAGSPTGTWDLPDLTTINASDSESITAILSIPSDFDGTIIGNINLSNGTEQLALLPVTINVESPEEPNEITECSTTGNTGDLDIEIRDISVTGFGDEDELFFFDQVEVEVRVENNGDDDIDDISVEWGLWDENSDDWVIEPDELDEISLSDGDDETLTFTFTLDDDMDIDLEDLEEGNYAIYVFGTGDVDNSNNDETCDSHRESVKIILERDFVVLSNLEFSENVECNSNVNIMGDVWNIGTRNQEDVSVLIQNSQLGLNEVVSVGDVDSMESAELNFDFDLNDAEAGTYTLRLSVLDKDDDVFQNENDDESVYTASLVVSGNCGVSDDVSVSAVLEDGGQAGKPLTVKATITNEGDNPGVFTLNIANYASWAELSEVSQNTLTLDAGSSGEVLITLDVKSDASGEEVFNVEVLSNDKLVANQPVSVTIKEKTKVFNLINADNWQIWAIAALNVLLIVIIIIVAIRIARK